MMESMKYLEKVARILQIPFMPTVINFYYKCFRGNPTLIKIMAAWYYWLDMNEAKIYWECYRSHRPNDVVGLEMMLWVKMGNWEDLTPEINELRNLKTPNQSLVQLTDAYNLVRENKFAETLKFLEDICFDETTETVILGFSGHCKGSLKDYDGAIKDYQRALAKNPNDINHQCNLASYLLDQNNCQQAEIHLKEVFKIDPENNLAKNLWLYLLLKNEKYQEGVDYYHTIKNDVGTDFHVRINLAECYFNLGKFELCADALRQAESINPHHEEVIALKKKLKEKLSDKL